MTKLPLECSFPVILIDVKFSVRYICVGIHSRAMAPRPPWSPLQPFVAAWEGEWAICWAGIVGSGQLVTRLVMGVTYMHHLSISKNNLMLRDVIHI